MNDHELDTAVAVEVMGWYLHGGHWFAADGTDTGWRDFADWHQWRPTRDIKVAWTVVEHMTRLPRTAAMARAGIPTLFALWWDRAHLWASSQQEAAYAVCWEALQIVRETNNGA